MSSTGRSGSISTGGVWASDPFSTSAGACVGVRSGRGFECQAGCSAPVADSAVVRRCREWVGSRRARTPAPLPGQIARFCPKDIESIRFVPLCPKSASTLPVG
jgi:hypothetical protein